MAFGEIIIAISGPKLGVVQALEFSDFGRKYGLLWHRK